MSHNKIGDDGTKLFSDNMKYISCLKILDLSCNILYI